MGIVYYGPYAEQVGYEDHEGYAARILPDGSLTATWTADTATFDAYVAACACGWRGGEHPPTYAGQDAAHREWDASHLQPLIATAAQQGWSAWAQRTAVRAREVAVYVEASRFDEAVRVLGLIDTDLAAWHRIAEELADEAATEDPPGRRSGIGDTNDSEDAG